MTPEGRVKAAVKKLLEKYNVYYFMPVSNGMGRHGIPDIICCADGRFVAIECKANGGKPTELQKREMQRIEFNGGIPLVVNDDPKTMEQLECLLKTLTLPSQ